MKHGIKGLLAVLVLSTILFFLWNQYYQFLNQGQRPTESTIMLDKLETEGMTPFELPDLKGNTVSVAKYTGKVVLINFWASWCAPCVEEFPSMIQLIKHFKGEIVLLAISADENKKDIETFLKAFDVKDPNIVILWDEGQKVAKSFGTIILPESYIFGKDFKLIRKVTGISNWYQPEAIEFFEDLVSK